MVPVKANPGKVQKKVDNRPFFQPQLSIEPTDNVCQQEADGVVDQIMRMPVNKAGDFFTPKKHVVKPIVQLKCSTCEEEDRLQRTEGVGSSFKKKPL